jgi:hypothetical protein
MKTTFRIRHRLLALWKYNDPSNWTIGVRYQITVTDALANGWPVSSSMTFP